MFQYIWVEALISCMEMNMTLVTIDNSSKSNDLNKLIKNTFGKNIRLWVGGIMTRYPRNHFIWLSTGKQLSYSFWSNSNPDFEGNIENCLQIGWGNNMEWNDRSCNYQHGYVCERDPQRLENEKRQQMLQQEIEQKQKLHETLKAKEQQEKILQQELQNIRNKLQQMEDKNLEVIKLKQVELNESKKREQELQRQVENFEKILEQTKEKNKEKLGKENMLQQELQDIRNELQQIKDKNLEEVVKLKQEELNESEKREHELKKQIENFENNVEQTEEKNQKQQEKEKMLQEELKNIKATLKEMQKTRLKQREVKGFSEQETTETSLEELNKEFMVPQKENKNISGIKNENYKKDLINLKLLSILKDKKNHDINVHFHQDHYAFNIINENCN